MKVEMEVAIKVVVVCNGAFGKYDPTLLQRHFQAPQSDCWIEFGGWICLKDILALTEIKIQIFLDKETTINDMLCLQIHLQQNLNIYIYIYTGIIINFSLYGQICEPSKCQEALVKKASTGMCVCFCCSTCPEYEP